MFKTKSNSKCLGSYLNKLNKTSSIRDQFAIQTPASNFFYRILLPEILTFLSVLLDRKCRKYPMRNGHDKPNHVIVTRGS